MNQWIESRVRGKSFVDVGGLGGHAINEKVTVALDSGAASATMIDIIPEGHEFWLDFRGKCAAKGHRDVVCLVRDLMAPDFAAVGHFDIVYNSGILYHVPDPVAMILQLRKIVRETLILVSCYVPERIENRAGRLEIAPGQSLFIPTLCGRTKEIVAEHLRGLDVLVAGLGAPSESFLLGNQVNYGPWWWLFTPSALRALIELCGFRVVDDADCWDRRARGFVCEPA
jgi:SAM-dependent methyltransferase